MMTIQAIKELADRIPVVTLDSGDIFNRSLFVKVGTAKVIFYTHAQRTSTNAFLVWSSDKQAQINLQNSSKEAVVAMILSCEDILLENAKTSRCVHYRDSTPSGLKRLSKLKLL